MIPNVNNLLDFARKIEGEVLETLRQKKRFRVEVIGNNIEIMPSTRNPRITDRKHLDALLQRFRETKSYRPTDYIDVTFNASYILALVKLWQENRALEKKRRPTIKRGSVN